MKIWCRIPTNTNIDLTLARWWAKYAVPFLPDVDVNVHVCNKGPAIARNEIIEQFLASDAEKLWFLDRDVVPMVPPDVTMRYLESDYPIVTGVYDIYEGIYAYPQVYFLKEGSEGPKDKYHTVLTTDWSSQEEFIRADNAGAGCLLLSRELLESIDPPWFEFGPNEEGEDIMFCEKAGGVIVHTEMICRHYKEVDLHGLRILSERLGEALKEIKLLEDEKREG